MNGINNLTTGDWILLISLIFTIGFHIVLICMNSKQRKFQKFHDVTQRLLDVGISLKDYRKEDLLLWDNDVLNQAEYISYLVNRGKINFAFLAGFWDKALIDYFDFILKSERHEKELRDKTKYPEFKKLYNRLRKYKNSVNKNKKSL